MGLPVQQRSPAAARPRTSLAAASSTVAYICGADYPPEGTVGLRFRFACAVPADVATVAAPAGGYSGGGLSLRLPAQPALPACAA